MKGNNRLKDLIVCNLNTIINVDNVIESNLINSK